MKNKTGGKHLLFCACLRQIFEGLLTSINNGPIVSLFSVSQ